MIVWLLAAAGASLLAALELRRPDRRNRVLRIVTVALAVAALATLLRPPLLPARPGQGGVAVLLTPGTDDAARRFLADSLPGVPLLLSPDSVPDLGALQRRIPGLRTAVVAGWGLRASQLARHGGLEIRRHPAPLATGFSMLEWTREVSLGAAASVYARLEKTGSERLVRFVGPAGERDSVRVPRDSVGRMVFRATPRATGVARLLVEVSGAVSDTLSVVVRPGTPPAVLIIEGYPAFETSFLRRWLARQGGSVAIRTTISRGRDRIDRVNFPAVALRPLTPGLLDRFDLVFLDGATLASLAQPERLALIAAVQTGGIGLLVSPDSLARRDPLFFPFRVSPTGDIEDRLVRPLWPGRTDRSTTPVPAAAESIDPVPTLLTVMRDPVGRILAGAVGRGAGWIGTSVVIAPSRWVIEQETAAFAGYWSALFAALARSRGDRWALLADGPVVPLLPVTLLLQSDDPAPAAVIASPGGEVDTLGLVQDLTDPSRWWGRFWPAAPGVYTAVRRGGEPYPIVVEAAAGSGREAAARGAATAWWAEQSAAGPAAGLVPRRQPLGPLGPFILLLLSLGLLWSEARAVSFFTSKP